MLELREGTCFPRLLVGVNVVLAIVDAIIAVFAFYQVCSAPFDFGFRFFAHAFSNLSTLCLFFASWIRW